MDTQIKKKLKIVLIAFAILIIPLGYLIAISFSIKIHNVALEKAMVRYPDDKSVIKESINEIDKAIRIYPWNYLFHMSKAELQIELNDCRGALISAKKATDLKKQYAEGIEYIGMIYEFLNQPDSAKNYYLKAIDKYKKRLENKSNNNMVNIEIALLYSFLRDSVKSNHYLKCASNDTDIYSKLMYDRYDYYIENYKSGGLKDFMFGETVEMVNNSVKNENQIDSLLNNRRIYYDSRSSISGKNKQIKSVYLFKRIFKNKAESIGFKEINK